MKRFAWLLMVPYIGIFSDLGKGSCYVKQGDRIVFTSYRDRVDCEGLAKLLNKESSRWSNPSKAEWEDANPEKQIKRPEPFDYHSACGQDDCGKEPK